MEPRLSRMRFLFSALVFPLALGAARGQERIDYLKDIKPLLREKCFACHGGLKQNAKLRVDTAELMKKGGRGGAAIVVGHPEKSLLIERITAKDADDRMPPESPPLSADQITKLRAWIAQGAPGPKSEQPERDPREHWAFVPPKKSAVPKAKNPDWDKNPIDAFLAASHEKHGLSPRPAIDRSLLLRRVYLDLVGLPPTSKELKAFLEDAAPDAYEKVVDRLLADPRHGERWGRHWMDVWRYSDWYGRRMVPDVWNSAPQIWRWRDWIVRSLNSDKGYDRMIQEMLAADEVCPEDDDATVATGFLVRNWYALNPNDWMRSNVEHVGKAFLGLTFNCAHCHDHKYDPISHDDYFRFRAYFEPIGIRQDMVAGETDPGAFQEYSYSALRKIVRLGTVRIFDKNADAPTWFYTGGDERNRVKEKGSMRPGVPAVFGASPAIATIKLPAPAYSPGLKPALRESLLKQRRIAVMKAEADFAAVRETKTPPALRKGLAEAEAALDRVIQTSAVKGESVALAGKQSLILDATTGRRILNNNLPGLKKFEEGASLRFDVLLIKDSYFNFQLAKDAVKGLTAGYVAFKKGKILSYRPGSFTEFDVGGYDFAGGQRRFTVTLQFQIRANQCLLSIRSTLDGKTLVDRLPVALNDWNPVGDATKAITFDAHPGSIAAVDDVVLEGPKGERLASFDFEAPKHAAGSDVVGADGWSASSFCVAPATSVAGMTTASLALRDATEKVRLARRAVEAYELKIRSAEARLDAAKAAVVSIETRIAADDAKVASAADAKTVALAKAAAQAERDASLKSAEAVVLGSDQALAEAEAKPAADPKRAKEVEAAAKQLSAAQAQLAKAQTTLKTPLGAHTPLGPTYPSASTGRRKALVEWMTGRDNPLTARVAVNHIWMRHFHAPLVSSVFDFGRNGAQPSHPELLDWLAVEFMESGWSMKKLHRRMVTSQAYRMASSQGENAEYAARDPANRFLWRANTGKMEAEVLRDSLFYVAGTLDFTMGGQELENDKALTTHRRSLYYSCHPEMGGKSALGVLFDAPDAGECYRRTRTVVPQQALALTNSDLIHEVSAKLAQRLWGELSPDEQKQPDRFVVAAFETVLSRRPSPAESKICVDFLQTPAADAAAAIRSRESLVRSLFNHNDFITIR